LRGTSESSIFRRLPRGLPPQEDSHASSRRRLRRSQTSKKARLASAEAIAEAPSGSGGVLPLTNFGTVSFSAVTVNGQPIGAFTPPDRRVTRKHFALGAESFKMAADERDEEVSVR
jgi:hypothetical protein